jgi:hypothetical protein
MGTPAPDSVNRLVDHFDQNRKVFLSSDYQTGTRDWGLGTGDPDPNPKPLIPNPSGTALGWDMDDTSLPRFLPEIGEASVLPLPKSRSRSPMGAT